MSQFKSLHRSEFSSKIKKTKRLRYSLKESIKRIINPQRLTQLLHIVRPTWDVVVGPLTYQEDGLATNHVASFLEDERFVKAYQAGKATRSWNDSDLRWRVYVACWAAEKGSQLKGDFVECGVFRGGISMAVAKYTDLAKSDRQMYLLDTYTGLSAKYSTEEERAVKFHMRKYDDIANEVRNTFSTFPNVHIVQGAVPETLTQVPSSKIAYLSLDMNSAIPEIAAAEYFWDKLVPGAVMVLDDYAYGIIHSGQKSAFDKFATARNVSVLSMPTGQGLIFKP
jgi:O-methyltransferase